MQFLRTDTIVFIVFNDIEYELAYPYLDVKMPTPPEEDAKLSPLLINPADL
jgi:hypothetical protein